MKKIFSLLVAVLFVSGMALAQDSPDKALKKAGRALGAYNLDQSNNGDKLTEAKDLIDAAIKDSEIANDAQAWITRGEIYNALNGNDAMKTVMNADHVAKFPQAALQAHEAFMKGFELADKKYMKKDAIAGLQVAQANLQRLGIQTFEAKDYPTAYTALLSAANLHQMLGDNGGTSIFADQTGAQDLKYYAGLAAINAGMADKATPLFEALIANDYDKAEVYDGLFKVYETTDKAKAEKTLMEARKRFPDNLTLLFSEINYYLKNDRLDELTDRLKTAIEKEPDNVSLYTTLGNVYDNLYQGEMKKEAKDQAKAEDYYVNAKKYYQGALDIDGANTDALYSMGALYFNQGALSSQSMQELGNDFSAAGLKKFDAKKAEMIGYFDEALPFFIKAEKADPTNTNTLIALKEIYARKDELTKVKDLGARLDAVNAGEKVDGSYFESKGM